jgi:hypothetical protein
MIEVSIAFSDYLPDDTSESEYYYAKATFEIIDSDVSGIEVKGNRGATISGVVLLEGNNDPAVRAMLHQATIYASTRPDPVSNEIDRYIPGSLNPPTKIGSDGSFRFSGLAPGRVGFHISSPKTSGFSILRFERNNIEMKDGIDVGRGEKVTSVRVIVLHGSGVLRGQVRIDGGKLPEAAQLPIWVRKTGNNGYTRFIEVDEKRHFVGEGLIPGEYEVSIKVRTRLNSLTGEVSESAELG